MRMREVVYPDSLPIDGYGPGFFRVGGEVRRGAVIVSARGVEAWAGLGDTAALLALAGEVDVLFLGTGDEPVALPAALRAAFEAAGTGVEAMASPAAARTYNVLLPEGRRIAAALVPVGDAASA